MACRAPAPSLRLAAAGHVRLRNRPTAVRSEQEWVALDWRGRRLRTAGVGAQPRLGKRVTQQRQAVTMDGGTRPVRRVDQYGQVVGVPDLKLEG